MLKHLLETTPQARERKFKNRALARVLQGQYPVLEEVVIETLTEVIGEALTLDRQWRKLLADNPELRGKDYGDKEELEQKAMINLGYLNK